MSEKKFNGIMKEAVEIEIDFIFDASSSFFCNIIIH